jgi:hypothetical protein
MQKRKTPFICLAFNETETRLLIKAVNKYMDISSNEFEYILLNRLSAKLNRRYKDLKEKISTDSDFEIKDYSTEREGDF